LFLVRTAKKTLLFTITKINWLTLFKEIIAVYSESIEQINTRREKGNWGGGISRENTFKGGGIFEFKFTTEEVPRH
jgi:hypothetical protein